MKKLFYILCFLISSFGYSQQIVELCEGNQTNFTYSSTVGVTGTYVWSINGNDFVVNPLSYNWDTPGEYEIKLVFTSLAGCKDSVTYNVSVIECKETTMWFPNAFTPNESGVNETWSPQGFNYIDLEYSIYNRWGEMIFSSNSESKPWDGKFKGYDCQQDVYVYMAYWRTIDKKPKRQYGHIVLIR